MNDELLLTESKKEIFDGRIDKTSHPKGCWIWTHTKDNNGYGLFWTGKRTVKCHRISYRMNNGIIPVESPFICHHCDNPSCVNPAHLYAGDHSTNAVDACKRGLSNPRKWSQENRGLISEAIKQHIADNPQWVKRGIDKPHVKLNDDSVRAIRREYAEGKIGVRRLAKKWNVSRTLIRMVIKNEIWAHVT